MSKAVCIKVANLRKIGYANLDEWMRDKDNVYTGRRGRIFIGSGSDNRIFHYKDSKWANPYTLREYELDKSLILYVIYLIDNGLIFQLDELKGKNLGCFCSKQKDGDGKPMCHAQVLVDLLGKCNHLINKLKIPDKGRVELEKRMAILRSIYKKGYEFPAWAIKKASDPDYGKAVTVYYDKKENFVDVEKVATEREPCNIGMSRCYNQTAMQQAFGWRTGYYGRHYRTTRKLAPNIGIICKTPVTENGKFISDGVWVYNAIGYAFDDVSQPDYNYFITRRKQSELIPLYEKVFAKIYAAARDHGLTTVVMSNVGGSSFAYRYKDDNGKGTRHFLLNIWVPAFMNVYNKNKDIKTLFMGMKKEYSYNKLKRYMVVKDIGFFPAVVKKVDTNKTLFVNAWDPWSLPGNGNENDPTLDGYIGRESIIGPVCFPPTNPLMQWKGVKLD